MRDNTVKRYPEWVYCSREDITQRNMKAYDRHEEEVINACLFQFPNYYELPLRKRFEIREFHTKTIPYKYD